MAKLSPLIMEIAERVRTEVEKLVPEWDPHGYDISHRNLAGACARASWKLQEELAKAGISSTFWMGHYGGAGHCWVAVDGAIVDITATQFNRPERVYATEEGEDKKYRPWASNADAYHLTQTWPLQQRPRIPA